MKRLFQKTIVSNGSVLSVQLAPYGRVAVLTLAMADKYISIRLSLTDTEALKLALKCIISEQISNRERE